MKTKHNETIQHELLDSELKEILSDNLPQAPKDEWFTRKVMNRLPDKPQKSAMGFAEKSCYFLGTLLLIGTWSYYMTNAIKNSITIDTLIAAVTVPLIAFICIAIYAIPAIKRAL